MRAVNQQEFSDWLLNIGNGKESTVTIPDKHAARNDIIEEIYGDIGTVKDTKVLTNRTILTANNDDATQINDRIIDMMNGDSMTYTSADSIVSDERDMVTNYPTEFLNKQQPSGMPPHKLTLKKGAIVMLLRNIDPRQGLLNDTRMVIDELHKNFLVGTVLTGHRQGETAVIPRIDMTPNETLLPFVLKRRQFPVMLAFAMTIHKSQGQSFDRVGVYLPTPVFTHGQLYVAVSRARYADGLKIYIGDGVDQGNSSGRTYTKNIVYHELLS